MADRWTAEAVEKLFVLRDEHGMTWKEIGSEIGRTATACRVKYDRVRLEERESGEGAPGDGLGILLPDIEADPPPPTFLELWREEITKPTWEEILSHAQQGADLHRRLRPTRTRAKRVIHTDQGNIFLVFISDFHLGAPGADIQAFLDTTNILLSDPRFYFIVVGPDLETAFTWFYSAEAILNQVLPPYMQIEAYRQWLDKMLPRCIGTCGDNHTYKRLLRVLGDLGIMWREDVPYFHGHGLIDLEIHHTPTDTRTVYQILAKHQHKGHSIYHNMQPALRAMRDIYPIADAYVIGHKHVPGYLNNVFFPEARPTKPRQHFIITGSFKQEDLYALYEFGGQGCLGVPTLWLDTKAYGIAYYDSPTLALQVSK